MTGIILDWRTSSCDQHQISTSGCDGAVISCHTDGFEVGMDSCLERGMDAFVVVSAGDDEIVERLFAEKGSGIYFICDAGLTETARLRDLAPLTQWVPVTDVYKVEASYAFDANAYQGGFKTYQLNPGSYEERRVRGGGLQLADWVERSKYLGFERVWIDSSEAEAVGKGFDLIAARRTSRDMNGGLWVSGGGTTLAHVQNLLNECAIGSVVVGGPFLAGVEIDQLRSVVASATTQEGEGQNAVEVTDKNAQPVLATG